MTVTATLAGAMSMLAQFGMYFGGGHRDGNGSSMGVIGTLLMVILALLAAMLVQTAISRSRYAADDLGHQRQPRSIGVSAGQDRRRHPRDRECSG